MGMDRFQSVVPINNCIRKLKVTPLPSILGDLQINRRVTYEGYAMGTACVRVLERCEASLGAGAGAPVFFERCLDVRRSLRAACPAGKRTAFELRKAGRSGRLLYRRRDRAGAGVHDARQDHHRGRATQARPRRARQAAGARPGSGGSLPPAKDGCARGEKQRRTLGGGAGSLLAGADGAFGGVPLCGRPRQGLWRQGATAPAHLQGLDVVVRPCTARINPPPRRH